MPERKAPGADFPGNDPDKVLRRVRKMEDPANHPGTSPEESRVFRERARELRDRYGLHETPPPRPVGRIPYYHHFTGTMTANISFSHNITVTW